MYNSIPMLIIFAAIVVLVIVVARRLPDIAAINTASIPEARAAATKRRLLRHRLERKVWNALSAVWQTTSRTRAVVVAKAARAHEHLLMLERRYRTKAVKFTPPPALPLGQHVSATSPPSSAEPTAEQTLLKKAYASLENNNYDESERQYLEVIRQDHRSAAAYRGLGVIYHKKRQFHEARQALEYALRLAEEAATYAALGYLCVDEGKLQEAEDHYKEAVKLDSQADYLDQLIEVCILVGDKRVAQSTLVRLREVAPTYSHLDDLGKRVAALSLRRKSGREKR